jgi:aminomethyltransferase
VTIVVTTDEAPAPLHYVPLDALHRALGARMVPFAGYDMPVQYKAGIVTEHLHCREKAALFDVSHMGQVILSGPPGAAAAALERLVPGELLALKPGRQRYTLLMNEAGGILDDLMVANFDPTGERLFLVVNASRRAADIAHIATNLPDNVALETLDDRALLALQGPLAVSVLSRFFPEVAALPFMGVLSVEIDGAKCFVTRSGYTGEDGFEISVPAAKTEAFARQLLGEPEVAPAGLGARDSLRLEAGLCLYGNDIDELTSPVEAGLVWVIGKRRRMAWDFPGAAVVRDQLDNGPTRLRVGLRPDGRAPARAGVNIVTENDDLAGDVTSGGFSPSLGAPIAMGYVKRPFAADGTSLLLLVRGKKLPAKVVPLPFLPHRFVR